jgi:hypothetical protein
MLHRPLLQDPILGVPADWALAVSHAGAGIVPDYPAGAIRHPTGAPLSASLDYALAAAVRPAPQRPASVPPPPSGSLHAADIEGASPSPLKCFQPQVRDASHTYIMACHIQWMLPGDHWSQVEAVHGQAGTQAACLS